MLGPLLDPIGSAVSAIDRGSRVSDFLTNYNFHVMDVSFSVPTVFSLSYGFQFCTAPELTTTTKEFKEGTFEYPRSVITGATVGDITFRRGARFFDSDFYDWARSSVRGGSGGQGLLRSDLRKNLLIIQYSDIATGIAGPTGSFGSNFAFQTFNSLVQRIPARAWLLIDCIPTHYKAGSDFDATGAEISIAELTVKPHYWEEFNTGI